MSLVNFGYKNINIAINISIKHFQRKDFVDRLCLIFDKKKFKKNTITLQFTDNLDVSKIETYKAMFEKVKEYGVRISVSNFEIKHEIMDVFKLLPIDEVKVSSAYLEEDSVFKKEVLKDIISLIKDLGYKLVITQVSDQKTLDEITKYDVDMIQGNYVFDILEQEKIPDFLENYKKNKK